MSGVRLVGLGEAMVLLTPADSLPLEQSALAELHVAGAELNLCAAAARLGVPSALCTRIGDDPFGRRVLSTAASLGVDTSLVQVDRTRQTGVFFKDTRPDGDRRVHYYRAGSAAAGMDGSDGRRLLAAAPELLVVSGITAALSDSTRELVLSLVQSARAAGVRVAFDPNLRVALGDVAGQVRNAVAVLPYTDVLVIGTDESPAILGSDDPAVALAAAAELGIAETVLKAGAQGCYLMVQAEVRHLRSQASSVVDPVGAGDAFAGGYLAGRLQGLAPLAAAELGGWMAAGVLASRGDNDGLPDAASAAQRLRALS